MSNKLFVNIMVMWVWVITFALLVTSAIISSEIKPVDIQEYQQNILIIALFNFMSTCFFMVRRITGDIIHE